MWELVLKILLILVIAYFCAGGIITKYRQVSDWYFKKRSGKAYFTAEAEVSGSKLNVKFSTYSYSKSKIPDTFILALNEYVRAHVDDIKDLIAEIYGDKDK